MESKAVFFVSWLKCSSIQSVATLGGQLLLHRFGFSHEPAPESLGRLLPQGPIQLHIYIYYIYMFPASRPCIYIYTFMLCSGICCICAFLVYLIDLCVYIYNYILYTVDVFKHTHFRNWHLFGVPGRWYSSLTLLASPANMIISLHTSWPQPRVNMTDVTKHQTSNSTIYKCKCVLYISIYT